MELDMDLRSRQEVRELVGRAKAAQEQLKNMSQAQIDKIIAAIAQAGRENAKLLAEMACQETGFGNVADKIIKNQFASEQVYNAIRDMKTVGILRQDTAQKVWEVGVPVGVIAGIAPSTNPTSTVIYKSMIALKGGNSIVLSPHPAAVKCSLKAAQVICDAARSAGCPDGAIGCISHPTMDAVKELMAHPSVKLILATGGGAMVHAAYSSGKPAIGVGAGNGPAYIHRSANVQKAVKDILRSKTFDNGTVCASEQSIVVEQCCADAVKEEFRRQGAYFLSTAEAEKIAALLLRPNGTMNPKIVGKTAYDIAQMAGVTNVPRTTPVLIAKETEAGPARPYSREKLCPVLAFFIEPNEDTVLEKVCEVLGNEGSGHTFAMHAEDEAVIRRFALRVPVSRFIVNSPAALGGIGATTGLFPAMTLGCGAVGGSSSSNNIGPFDLINIRRVAWGIHEPDGGHTTTGNLSISDDIVAALTEQILKKLR